MFIRWSLKPQAVKDKYFFERSMTISSIPPGQAKRLLLQGIASQKKIKNANYPNFEISPYKNLVFPANRLFFLFSMILALSVVKKDQPEIINDGK